MNPHIQAVAQSRQEELLRQAHEARRAAGLRSHSRFAARLIKSIRSSGQSRRPAADLPTVIPVSTDA